MARDYKHAEVFSSGTRPLPMWLWLFAALAVSGFIGLIYYLDQYEKAKAGGAHVEASEPKALMQKNADDKTAEESKPRFDFYKLLPKISVDVPKNQTEQRQSLSGSDEQTAKQNAISFILQAGSFKEFQEADRLKASLALVGIHANIEKVTLNASEVWHRVRIGPIQSEREMNKIRGQLRHQNIEPVLLKVKS